MLVIFFPPLFIFGEYLLLDQRAGQRPNIFYRHKHSSIIVQLSFNKVTRLANWPNREIMLRDPPKMSYKSGLWSQQKKFMVAKIDILVPGIPLPG